MKPAARLTDMHACPMQTPAIVPIPHVGGPIVSQGATTVLVEGLPAARVGDICICVGPPAPIVLGSFTVLIEGSPAARVGDMTAHGGAIIPPGALTVLIGDAGGGAGSPAAATMSNARATGAAFVQTNCSAESVSKTLESSPLFTATDPQKSHFIEIELVDQKKRPVAHQRFRIVPPGANAKPIEGFLDAQGFARVAGIDGGMCKITFPDLDASSWKPERGDPGRRTRPEPAPVPAGRPGIKSTSVILETVAKPPGVKRESVTLKSIVIPVSARPGVIANTVQLRLLQRPGVQPGSVTLRVVSGTGKFVNPVATPADADVIWDAQSTDPVGDVPPIVDDGAGAG